MTYCSDIDYSSYRQIFALSLPAILLNAAAPAVTTTQTVLLGRLRDHGKDQVAAFAAASVVANFLTFLLNFMARPRRQGRLPRPMRPLRMCRRILSCTAVQPLRGSHTP